MKKFLILLGLLMLGLSVNAEIVMVEGDVNMANFWEKNGKDVQKIMSVGTHIINANRLDKHIPIELERTPNVINAYSYHMRKTVVISSGILPYMDNDDELAYILGHEMAHSLDAYGGFFKWAAMRANTREYEYKADLIGIDLMVKAGYNPIAAITLMNKCFPEDPFDLFFSHPVTTKRQMAIYKYVYMKYPWALQTDMIKNINYVNFTYAAQKEINAFQQRQKARDSRKIEDL